MQGVIALLLLFAAVDFILSEEISVGNSVTCSASEEHSEAPVFKNRAELQSYIDGKIEEAWKSRNHEPIELIYGLHADYEDDDVTTTTTPGDVTECDVIATTESHPTGEPMPTVESYTTVEPCIFSYPNHTGCEIDNKTKFWVEIDHDPSTRFTYAEAVELCRNNSGRIATSMNRSVYEAVLRNVSHLKNELPRPTFWIGASLNRQNCTLTPQCAYSWREVFQFDENLGDHLLIKVHNRFRVWNIYPTNITRGVVCQGERSCNGTSCINLVL